VSIPARVSIVTLGTHDFHAMRAFYRGLGWREAASADDFAAFHTGGAVLALYPFEKLAEDARVTAEMRQPSFRGFAFALNVDTREMVDSVVTELRERGARITKEPEDAFWGGRTAYFADPEGNLWEVAWNPDASFDDRGNMTLSATPA
jgi:catechol 2,3-dioxygenase-like lactoylglutathione lyase family enzyme